MKIATLILASCISGLCNTHPAAPNNPIHHISIENAEKPSTTTQAPTPIYAGKYLASRFAQQHHDWNHAYKFLSPIIEANKDQDELQRRAMVLAMGAGDYKSALQLARDVNGKSSNDQDILANLFLVAESFKTADYKEVYQILDSMPDNHTARFIGPFVKAWTAAAQNKLSIGELQDSTLKLYHAILISDYLDDYSEIKKTLVNAQKVEDIQPAEYVKIGDIYGHIGLKEDAIKLYKKAQDIFAKEDFGKLQVKIIGKKISDVQSGANKALFEEIRNPKEGLSKAFYDIANTLFSEGNDETAQIFAHIALYITPENYDVTLLLADIAAKYEQYSQALTYYQRVPKDHADYIPARHKMADMLVEINNTNKALNTLEQLAYATKDVKTRIRIGDIYRRNEQYGLALDSYNKAAKEFGHDIPDEYWHIYYLRGMAHEQAKNWENAEKDLQKALSYRPDHPYLLNYLGYAWADRGQNLDEALKMIRRAVELRPNDGYIIDSLGWVEYRLGNYEAAIPSLEKAEVEYLEVPQSEPLRNECQHFINVVSENVEPLTNGDEGLSVLKVLSAASLSESKKEAVKLNIL